MMSKTSKLVELYKQGHTDKTVDHNIASRSFRYDIYKRYQQGEFDKQPPKGSTRETTGKPALKLKTAGEKTPEEKLRIIQPGKPGEIPTPSAMLFTWEDCSYIFEGINQLIPEKRQPSEKSTQLLGKLWYKPINNLIEKYSDQNPLLVIAALITITIYAPSVIGSVQDWRKEKEKQKKKPKEKKEDEV